MRPSFAERGAVNILFLVMVLVVALVFGVLWFTQLQKNEQLEKAASLARIEATASEDKFSFYRDYYSAVAKLIGGGLPEQVPWDESLSGTVASEKAADVTKRLEDALRTIGGRVDDGTSTPAKLVDALEVPVSRYLALKGEIGQKNQEIAALKSQVETKDKSAKEADRAHQEEKARIQTENDANVSRLTQQLTDVRAQNEEVQTKVRDSNTELDTTRTTLNKEKQDLLQQTKEAQGQVRSMKSEIKIKRATETPDGKILSADPRSGLAMIDVPGSEFLKRGTRFKVYENGKGGTKIHKGYVTVTNLGPNMSEGRIDETVPGSGDIGNGDWLYNPVFDRKDQQHFFFLGRLPGRYNKEIATRILTSFGAAIDPKVTVTTHFLVLGEKEDLDGEELTESPEYKNAMTWGVEVIRAQDLAPFLQM